MRFLLVLRKAAEQLGLFTKPIPVKGHPRRERSGKISFVKPHTERRHVKAEPEPGGIRSTAFKSWFGDWETNPRAASKVVDRTTGEPKETHPIVVFHGTAVGKQFRAFSGKKAADHALFGPGFYFTENRDVATAYIASYPKTFRKLTVPADQRQAVLDDLERMAKEQGAELSPKDLSPSYTKRAASFLEHGRIYYLSGAGGTKLERLVAELAAKYDTGAEIKACYLSIKDPIDLDARLTSEVAERLASALETRWTPMIYPNGERATDRLRAWGHEDSARTVTDALEQIAAGIRTGTYTVDGTDYPNILLNRHYHELCLSAGFDGMTHMGGRRMGWTDHRVWIALHPWQIKAVENEGTWDPANPDIYKSHIKGYTKKDGTFVAPHDDKRTPTQPELTMREPTGGDQVIAYPYASGMSRRRDMEAAIESSAGLGTEIGELSSAGIDRIALAISEGKPVFVDSGAFNAFRRAMREQSEESPQVDFAQVIDKYNNLSRRVCERAGGLDRSLLMLVAPDVVGDQRATLELLAQHRDAIMGWLDAGHEVIVPFQKGPVDQYEAFEQIARLLEGRPFVVGIPSSAAALSNADFARMLAHPYKPDRLHILGAISSRRMDERMGVIRDAYIDEVPGVTADANVMRSKLHELGGLSGDKKFKAIKNILNRVVPEIWGGTKTITKAVHDHESGRFVSAPLCLVILAKGGSIRYRTTYAGLPISIETDTGDVRHWTDPHSGEAGQTTMQHPYGYIRGTVGADNEAIDCFLGPKAEVREAYIIHQLKAPTFTEYDEDKIMLGFPSKEAAIRAYLDHYNDPRFLGEVDVWPMDELVSRLKPSKIPTLAKAVRHPEYEKESAAIRELAKTTEAQKPHRFRPAEWTYPNGHPRCALCGEEEPESGQCHGRRRRGLLFGKASCPAGEHCRWITVHPHGPGTEGQPIMIRESKTSPGTFHVIGGAGGSLNYLRLTGIKSNEDYRQQARTKAKASREEQREQTKRDKEAGTFKSKQAARTELRDQRVKTERKLIQSVAEAAGWTDYDLREDQLAGLSETAQKMAQTQHHRQLLSKAMDVVKQTRERLLLDAEARAEAKLGELSLHRDDPTELGLTDLEPDPPDRGLGFAPRYTEKAEISPEDLESEISDIRTRLKAERGEEGDRGSAMQDALAASRKEVETATEAGKLARPEPPVKPVAPERAGALLAMAKQVKQEQAAVRKELGRLKTGTPEQGKAFVLKTEPVSVDEIRADLEADAAERTRQDVARSFLQAVEGEGDPASRAAQLQGHLALGATTALTRASQVLTGQDVITRDLVDVLGAAGTAQALVAALHRELGEQKVGEFAQMVERYHQEHHQRAAAEATAHAQELVQQAKEIELGTIDEPVDLPVASELNERRRELLSEARATLGTTLGELEATAALELALKQPPVSELQVSLGALPAATAVKQARALGLAKGDYSIDSDGKNHYLTIQVSGLPKLIKPIDREEMEHMRTVDAIYRGEHDEEGWLPDGFAQRPKTSYSDPTEQAITFRRPFSLDAADSMDTALGDYVGARMADGEPVGDIYRALWSEEVLGAVPADKRADYLDTIERIAPLYDADGKPIRAEAHAATFERLAESYVRAKYGAAAAPLHQQRLDVENPKTYEALHRTLAVDPRRMVAFTKVGDLTPQDQAVLRQVFQERFSSQEMSKDVQVQLEELGPEPAKQSEGLFGVQENPDWREWQTKKQTIVQEARQRGLTWDKYLELHHSREHAYQAIQDVLKSDFVRDFSRAYGQVHKQPLKMGRTVLTNNLAHLDAVDPQAREVRLAEQRDMVDRLRNRVEGRYATGSVKDKLDRVREMAEIADQNQRTMFLADADEKKAETPLAADERYTLGATAESQLSAMLPQVSRNFDPQRPVSLRSAMSMSGGYVNQQRAIKLIAHNKRMALALGTGSGKTAIGLGAFTHLHQEGKVRRGIFAVPSIVQGQFGGEAAAMLKPGTYQWWGKPAASREERLAAYKDPQHHFVVVTHQALRDDLIHLYAEQQSISEEQAADRFKTLSEGERQIAMRQTLDRAGISFDYFFGDEFHDALNRKGKPDSLFANVIDAVHSQMPYYVAASADPMKNDMSELYDLLHKVNPQRYTDRDGFLAKYGVRTSAVEDTLKRELRRSLLPGRVDPGVKANQIQASIALTDKQHAAYDGMMKAYRDARLARSEGRSDVASLQRLSPKSFEGLAADQHDAVASRLSENLGILRDQALDRVLNLSPATENAKVREVLERAHAYREAGKPGLIFAHNLDAVSMLKDSLEQAGHRVAVITGADSAKTKAQKIQAFRPSGDRPASVDILLCSDAGAVGMNAQRGKWVLNYDYPHTAKTWWQRIGRIHRLGQTEDVDVVNLHTDTIADKKRRDRIERKSGLRDLLTSPYESLDEYDSPAAYSPGSETPTTKAA